VIPPKIETHIALFMPQKNHSFLQPTSAL
jgi:hypothetical protein